MVSTFLDAARPTFQKLLVARHQKNQAATDDALIEIQVLPQRILRKQFGGKAVGVAKLRDALAAHAAHLPPHPLRAVDDAIAHSRAANRAALEKRLQEIALAPESEGRTAERDEIRAAIEGDDHNRNAARVRQLFLNGRWSKGKQILHSNGMADTNIPATLEKVKALFPAASQHAFPALPPTAHTHLGVDVDDVKRMLQQMDAKSSGGMSQLGVEHLRV
jgi:hypothetical protein